MPKLPTLDELHTEVAHLRKHHALPSDDQAFLLWYSAVALTGNEQRALDTILGGPRDVNVDALFIDDPNQTVFLVQGKYHSNERASAKRSDLLAFRSLGHILLGATTTAKSDFAALLHNADPLLAKRLSDARDRILKKSYFLSLRFVSTGSVSAGLLSEFERSSEVSEFIVSDSLRVRTLFRNYLDGAAPPVPFIEVALDMRDAVRRYDKTNGIESWVVTLSGSEVAKFYRKTGPRIFARNIRGFLGSTDINKGLHDTLRNEPERFWYYNNGITIVCDRARRIQEQGKDRLRIDNPQIINGQQTTRAMAETPSSEASVLLRVTAFPRDTSAGEDLFSQLIGNIVAATNRQNPISASDLRANDAEQVRLEREFLKRSYLYVRKRQSKREARANAPQKTWWTIRKEQLAQAVAACFLNPYEVRLGKENLFETENYERVFSNRSIATYLACFWARTLVRRSSKGRPERAYAFWLVLHMLWKEIEPRFPGHRRHEDMVWYLERHSSGLAIRYAGSAVDELFRDALSFFRRNRGHGEEAADVSTFFKSKDLQKRFDRFWHRSSNPRRIHCQRGLDRFANEVTREIEKREA